MLYRPSRLLVNENFYVSGRFENEWLELTEKRTLRKTGRLNPKPPHNIDIVRGSAYAVFSRQFVEFIVNDKRARDLLEWSRRTWSPDEFYWSTLHHVYANPHLHTPGGYPGEITLVVLISR